MRAPLTQCGCPLHLVAGPCWGWLGRSHLDAIHITTNWCQPACKRCVGPAWPRPGREGGGWAAARRSELRRTALRLALVVPRSLSSDSIRPPAAARVLGQRGQPRGQRTHPVATRPAGLAIQTSYTAGHTTCREVRPRPGGHGRDITPPPPAKTGGASGAPTVPLHGSGGEVTANLRDRKIASSRTGSHAAAAVRSCVTRLRSSGRRVDSGLHSGGPFVIPARPQIEAP